MQEERFATVALQMRKTLERCVTDPDVRAIHRARTGSRRVEAALDALERESSGSEVAPEAVGKLRKLLKRIRRGAGQARDADVHRALLRKLVPKLAAATGDAEPGDAKEAIVREAEALDAMLLRRREKKAAKFSRRAESWETKLKRRIAGVVEEMVPAEPKVSVPQAGRAADLALESFAGLCREIPVLEVGTLHEFRKGAKHARYIAEAGEDDESQQLAGRLKRVQDSIGVWHDWLMLAEEAQAVAEEQENELVKRIEAKRDRQYHSAVRMTEQIRRELLAMWKECPGAKKDPGSADLESLQAEDEMRKTA